MCVLPVKGLWWSVILLISSCSVFLVSCSETHRRGTMHSTSPSAHCHQSCENEQILMQTGTSGPWRKTWNITLRSGQRSRSQDAKVTWLPVLFNIEPPALRRKAATDKLVEKIVKHDSWPIQPDILSPPLLRLTSRKPLWLDLQPVDIKSRWRHNWKSAQVVNSHLVCDPTIWQPGFDLPRQQWSLLNVFAQNRDTAVPAEGNGDLQTLICVLVARPRRCLALSNPVPWQNWMAPYLGMKTLFHGWPVMVHDMHTRNSLICCCSH